jgi:hypothetical protein
MSEQSRAVAPGCGEQTQTLPEAVESIKVPVEVVFEVSPWIKVTLKSMTQRIIDALCASRKSKRHQASIEKTVASA